MTQHSLNLLKKGKVKDMAKISYVVVDEKGNKYRGFQTKDEVEEFRLFLFMEYGYNSFDYMVRDIR